MKRDKLFLQASGLLFAASLTGCIDNAYDLSDVDTTTRINVNDLTIPVNMDRVTLDDIIDFDENSKIKAVTIGGEEFYALTESGTFSSDPVNIAEVTAPRPEMAPTVETLDRVPAGARKGRLAPASAVPFAIKEMGNDFTYVASGVDPSIKEITAARTDKMTFAIRFTSQNIADAVAHTYISDLRILMPRGLDASPAYGSYDARSGVWTIPSIDFEGAAGTISLDTDGIDFTGNDSRLDSEKKTFSLHSSFKVLSGTVALQPKTGHTIPERISFRADYTLSPLDIRALSGSIDYHLEGMDINPIELTDIPDFLSCEGTNILLDNPQIYLSLNNPLASYSLKGNTGLTLTARRPAAPSPIQALRYSLDNGPLVITADKGTAGPYQYVLSPSADNLNIPEGYSSPRHYSFSGLSDLLAVPSGFEGYSELPQTIDISLTDPSVPLQKVKDFALGTNIAPFTGKYELVAPLALKPGSLIIYSDTENGWNDEDVDGITIERLTVNAIADSDIPLSAEIVAYPLDVDGNRIPNVSVQSNILPPSAKGFPIEIVLTGEVKHLDGIVYEARVRPGESSSALAPQQTITLRDIRAKVSGYWTKKF